MKFTIWYSRETFADFIIANTKLADHDCDKRQLAESDASKPNTFHKTPDHLKKILYLDAPDIIIETDQNPILSIEESKESGTGHNAFQRFSRLSAAVENGIPAFYIYPEAVLISRENVAPRWDKINASIFKALDRLMDIYDVPALLFYHPSLYRQQGSTRSRLPIVNKGLLIDNERHIGCPVIDSEMRSFFNCINILIEDTESLGRADGLRKSKTRLAFTKRRDFHAAERIAKNPLNRILSPETSVERIPTDAILRYIKRLKNIDVSDDSILRKREETLVYKIDATFRGDPYPGALAAIDYMLCRNGKTFEDRIYNLVLAWGDFKYINGEIQLTGSDGQSINTLVRNVQASERKALLQKDYNELRAKDIPRYYMQVRYGSMFTKQKHIRIYAYFSDVILFSDGVLWREN